MNAFKIEPEPEYPTRDRIIVPRLFIFEGDLHLQEDEVWIRLWVMNHAKREYTFTIGCKIPCIPSWGHPHERVLLGGDQVTKQSILDECREKALSKISKKVNFSYPEFGKLKGVLVDRVVMHNKSVTGIKEMFRVIDLIEFDVDGKKKQLIRFGYYTFKDGDWRWGSQTTYSDTPDEIAKLFIIACGRPWFKDIMLRVCKTG